MDLDFASRGLVRRRDLALSDGAISRALSRGGLRRLYPDVYATSECTLDPAAARRLAALLYAGADSRLSCASACAEWGLVIPDSSEVHVTTGKRQVRRVELLVAHRRRHSLATSKDDVPVSSLETAVVEAFGCLERAAGRELLIGAVRERRIDPKRLRAAAIAGCRARPALLALLAEVSGGSHSEAELALIQLIRDAGLPEPTRQLRVRIGGRSAYLDLAFEAQRVAVEADSRRWHFSAEQRAADIRRDALLSAAGWTVLRFLYEQIVNESQWVAARIAETLATRTPAA